MRPADSAAADPKAYAEARGLPRPPLPALTGLRFIAASAVLLFHYGAGFAGRAGAPLPIRRLLDHGYLGVSLFFILSGFILTYTYEGKLPLRARPLASYGWARFCRIYPVYLLALLVALPLAWSTLDWGRAAAVLLMVQSWPWPGPDLSGAWIMQAWTLSVEFFFYLLFPALLALAQRAGIATLMLAIASLALLIVTAATPFASGVATVWPGTPVIVPTPILRLPEFGLGMMLALIFLRQADLVRRFAGTVPTVAALAVSVALLACSSGAMALSATMVLVALLILQLAAGRSIVATALGGRPMLLLGSASYAMYLFQQPVREWLRRFPGGTAGELLNPGCAIGVALLVYTLVERPARSALRRLVARRGADAFVQTSPQRG